MSEADDSNLPPEILPSPSAAAADPAAEPTAGTADPVAPSGPAPFILPARVAIKPDGTAPAPTPRPSGGFMPVRSPRRRFFGFRFLALLIKVVLCVATPATIGYLIVLVVSPPARRWAMANPGPTPSPTVNEILAIPAKMIGGTEIVVARNNARVDALDRVIAGTADPGGARAAARQQAEAARRKREAMANLPVVDDAPASEAPTVPALTVTPPPPPLAAAPASAAAAVAPPPPPAAPPIARPPAAIRQMVPRPKTLAVSLPDGTVASRNAPEGEPVAAAPFFNWVIRLEIGGVDQTPPGRILVNGRYVVTGQQVSAALGVTFDQLDTERRLMVFRDTAGTVVTRSY